MVSALVQALADIKTEIRRRFAWVYDKLGSFLGVFQQAESCYSLSEQEARMVEQARQLAEQTFGYSAGEQLAALSPQRRMAVMEDFVYSLLDLCGMPDCDVVITDAPEIFPEAEAACCMGKCSLEEGVIYLNSHFLLQSHEGILKKCALAAVHEVRHMMQWQAVCGMLELTVPAATVETWRVNYMEEYIRASADLQGYYEQPVEYDARNFACLVMGEL